MGRGPTREFSRAGTGVGLEEWSGARELPIDAQAIRNLPVAGYPQAVKVVHRGTRPLD